MITGVSQPNLFSFMLHHYEGHQMSFKSSFVNFVVFFFFLLKPHSSSKDQIHNTGGIHWENIYWSVSLIGFIGGNPLNKTHHRYTLQLFYLILPKFLKLAHSQSFSVIKGSHKDILIIGLSEAWYTYMQICIIQCFV